MRQDFKNIKASHLKCITSNKDLEYWITDAQCTAELHCSSSLSLLKTEATADFGFFAALAEEFCRENANASQVKWRPYRLFCHQVWFLSFKLLQTLWYYLQKQLTNSNGHQLQGKKGPCNSHTKLKRITTCVIIQKQWMQSWHIQHTLQMSNTRSEHRIVNLITVNSRQ